MKKQGILIAALCLLTACTNAPQNSSSQSSQAETSQSASKTDITDKTSDNNKQDKSDEKPEQEKPEVQFAETSGTLPVIAIQTKSTDKNALDFVTEPVNEYVAKSIASWTPGYNPPAPYYEECCISVKDTDGTVMLDSADADVKVRGNWTTTHAKKPLRIKFAEKQSMLGMNEGGEFKNWMLMAEYKDLSMLRNKTALQIANEILGEDGYYASDARLVEVTINGEYFGVYLLTEMQQINEGRVDITKPEKDYTGTDIGYLMEFDGYYKNEDELNRFWVSYCRDAELTPYDGEGGSGKTATPLSGGSNDVGISIKSDIYSQEQHDFIASYVNNVYKIMYEAAYNDKAYVFNSGYTDITEDSSLTPQQAVEAAVDIQSLADSYIMCELTCDADLYWSSFYMDADFGEGGSKKLTFEAPWDFDSALGNKDRCASGEGFYAANILKDVNDNYRTINPWLAVLANEDWYQEIVRDRWAKAYDSGVFTRAIEAINSDSESYSAAFELNYGKWDIRSNESAGEWCRAAAACQNEKQAADYLASWLTTRVDFLNSQWGPRADGS